ncbi:MAG TPA: PDZ domain-containing protein [Bryobacteraceae bacterium]|nr:PDZ domain-containing protein [Bryobacteraceae bacterium]
MCAAIAAAQDNVTHVSVDATDAAHHLIHSHLTMPVKAGPLTLLYPEWIPGEHGPTGPVVDMAGLKMTANGQAVVWARDPVNMYALHLTVPDGASTLDIAFDQIQPPETAGFSSGASTTSELALLSWNQFLLYPEGPPANRLEYQATLRVPHSWRFGTALPIARESGDEIEFQTVPLDTLIDSPVSTGAHFRTIDIGRDLGAGHYLHIAGDSERAIEIGSDQIEHYRNLVKETGALFGSRHYRDYHFLVTLSDHVASFGLEHHESSDDRFRERAMIEDSGIRYNADTLPHEFVHSWNGKYRRPAGLVTPDYSEPMKGGLLWVYEGLTQYLGEVLAARTGLLSADDSRDRLALDAAELDRRAGRKWRPLEDTADAAQILYNAREDYSGYRRSVDYYEEGALIWLEADVLIRVLSKGKKSLNDFCREFEGGAGGAPALKPYTFEDVAAAMNAVQPYDWATFFHDRVDAITPHAPMLGIENGGWKLVLDSSRPDYWRVNEDENRYTDMTLSIGLMVKDDGGIVDVVEGGPAQKAGIAPNDKLIAVDNRQFTPAVLREAVQKTAQNTQSIDLLMKNGEYYSVHRIEYQGGEKFPHLERDKSKRDILSQILAPLVKAKAP